MSSYLYWSNKQGSSNTCRRALKEFISCNKKCTGITEHYIDKDKHLDLLEILEIKKAVKQEDIITNEETDYWIFPLLNIVLNQEIITKLMSGMDSSNLKESHLNILKLENTIRRLKRFSYANGSGSSFGSSDTPIEKHLTESCYDITNFHKYSSLPSPVDTSTDVPYHKHIRYGFEPEIDCIEEKKKVSHTNLKKFSLSCSNVNLLDNSFHVKNELHVAELHQKSENQDDFDSNQDLEKSNSQKNNSTIALPRSLGLSRKWKGPVRYPVTPIKKEHEISDNDNSLYLTASDDEQVFI